MGQRLNIEITHNNKCLANCYYHWSGYSSSAAQLTDIIINSYFDKEEEYINTDFTSFDIFAVELLESTGARLDKRELERYKQYCNHEECISRVNGIIGVSEDIMNETRRWEEARVTIDLKHETVDFCAVGFEDEESYDDWREDNSLSFSELPIAGMCVFGIISFDDFHNVADYIKDAASSGRYYFKEFEEDTGCISLIE